MSISNSTLTYNRADQWGGAIHVGSGLTVSIFNSELTNNSADYGGGVINVYSGSVSISNSELTYNNGEVICVGSANASIINSTIANNNASYGGVINIFQSALILKDTNITNNMASSMENGGIIYVFDSRVEFNGPTTLSNNRGVFGGAISALTGVKYSLTQKELSSPTIQLPLEEGYF